MIRLFLLGALAGALIYTLDDAAEARAQADLYCQMVEEGSWPDYRGDYMKKCFKLN
jgi:hypothetical protein